MSLAALSREMAGVGDESDLVRLPAELDEMLCRSVASIWQMVVMMCWCRGWCRVGVAAQYLGGG